MSIRSQFDDLLRDIEPSPTTVTRAQAAHKPLRKFLAEHDDFSAFHKNTFLAGSYMRDTSIRPKTVDGVTSKPDVDIIVVTNFGLDDDPKSVLENLRDILAEEYELDDKPHQRSVGLITEHVEMDVVPIIAPYGDYGPFYLADKKVGWQQTNPARHTTWSTEVNKAVDGRFKPLVKLFKWWRRESPGRFKRPKGFVLETVAAECMNRSEKRYPELFLSTLEGIVNKYEYTVIHLEQVPFVADPGVPGNSVTRQLTLDSFQGFVAKAKAHAALGREALATDDAEKALKKWREIFGDRFPRDASTRVAGGLLDGAAAASGAFAFPDKAIRPRTPGGFA